MEDTESTEKSPFLNMNDDCVTDILRFLQYNDLVNLSKTCNRLRAVCIRVCFSKYSEIEIQARVQNPLDNRVSPNLIHQLYFGNVVMQPKTDFKNFNDYINFAALVGKNFLRIREPKTENNINNDVMLLFSCTPLHLSDHEGPRGPRPRFNYRTEKKLKLPDVVINGNEFSKCFLNKPALECEYDGSCNRNVMALLVNLPKLISIRFEHILPFFNDLKLSTQVFNTIASFENLEVLSLIGHVIDKCVIEKALLPLKLKKIKINHPVAMSFEMFVLIVERLRFLEEIDVDRSRIFWHLGDSTNLGTIIDPLLIYQIVNKFNQRKLNIFTTDPSKKFQHFYKSDNLNIINREPDIVS